jgi:hypothetical protein
MTGAPAGCQPITMATFKDNHLRLSQLLPLASAAVRTLAVAWEVRMAPSSDQFPDLRKLIPNPLP